MPDPEKDANAVSKEEAKGRVAASLESGIQQVKTPEDAARVLDTLEAAAGAQTEPEVSERTVPVGAGEAADAIGRAKAAAHGNTETAATIYEVARQVAAAAPEDKAVLDEAIAGTAGLSDKSGRPPEAAQRSRRLLRQELLHRLRPLAALDAIIFIEVNHLPHPPAFDRAMSRFSWVMTAGTGWLAVLVAGILRDRTRGWQTTLVVAPSIWLATITVEQVFKRIFRRRRPFISLIHAVVVGRKPGSYSFPSGHSAAAFAGAVLLSRAYPCRRQFFYAVASLVAFSRIYLGAHYPGDVLSGSVAGASLGRLYAAVIRKLLAGKRG